MKITPSRFIIPKKSIAENHHELYIKALAVGVPKSFSTNVATAIEMAKTKISIAINRVENNMSMIFFTL